MLSIVYPSKVNKSLTMECTIKSEPNTTQQVVLDALSDHISDILDQTKQSIPDAYTTALYALLEKSISHPEYNQFTDVLNKIFPENPNSSNATIKKNFLRFYHLAECKIPDDDWIVVKVKELGGASIPDVKKFISSNLINCINDWKKNCTSSTSIV